MKTVFLDRDGVINADRVNYVLNWDEFKWLPGVKSAVARLTAAGFRIVIFTNQSCIGRELITADGIDAINARMIDELTAAGGSIEGVYVCPHAPEKGDCDCRKPKPGLLLQAAEEMGLDLARSVVIGDSARDLQAGRAAGVGLNILVRTGKGAEHEKKTDARPDLVVDDLAAAVDYLLGVGTS